jgi:hypothetical protein
MRTRTLAIAAAALAAALTVASSAAAREHDEDHENHEEHGRGRGGTRTSLPPDPVYVKECGSCHLAYPPRLLSAASWRRVMAGLDRHFGQDAELEPAERDALERWLVERAAGNRGASAEAPIRITDRPWFLHEHDDVPRGAVARPSIRTMANCAACHPGAGSWDFDEDRAKIPAR